MVSNQLLSGDIVTNQLAVSNQFLSKQLDGQYLAQIGYWPAILDGDDVWCPGFSTPGSTCNMGERGASISNGSTHFDPQILLIDLS